MSDDQADLKKEVEKLRDEVKELQRMNLRIFKAFSCADSTLRLRYDEDMRSLGDIDEADRLKAYMTGDAQP